MKVDRKVQRTATSVRTRAVSLVVFVAALATYVELIGLPKQTLAAVSWIWLAYFAWDVWRPPRAHLEFVRDWWLPLALLTLYLYSRGLADELGFSVHVTEPIEADRWLFGGTLPTEYLQGHLCGVPCARSMPPNWYDVLLTTVYYSHFFVALTIAAWLWVRNRPAWIGYMRRYLTLTFVALVGYVTYPMAPPWMASRDGYLTDNISRITGRGWSDLGSASGGGGVHQNISAVGNQVAAMPSFHAGLAAFVTIYAITRLPHPQRWLLLLYPIAMGFMLVYYAEHYVIDVLAGWACVALVLAIWSCLERKISPQPAGDIRVGKAPD